MSNKRKFLELILFTMFVFALGTLTGWVLSGPKVIEKTVIQEKEPIFVYVVQPTVIPEEPEEIEEPLAINYEELEDMEDEEEPKVKSITYQTINRDFNVLLPSGYTADQLRASLPETATEKFSKWVDAFVQAEEQYGVNSLYLMSKLGLESGWGKYTTGTNNIAGWKSVNGGWMNFNTPEECILHVAKYLSTTYKETVGTRLEDVCNRYCTDEGYIQSVLRIMKARESKIKAIKEEQ